MYYGVDPETGKKGIDQVIVTGAAGNRCGIYI